MENRPPSWNGQPVPYGANVDELTRLAHGPAPARWPAFVALAYTPGESALAVLRESAASPDPAVRRIAIEAVGVHPEGRRLAAAICALLSDPKGFVVRSACEAAGRQRLAEAHDAILRLLAAAESATRATALHALGELWQPADFERVLRAFTSDRSVEVRKQAAWTLREHASRSNWRALFEVWHGDAAPRHRQWACELAAAHGGVEVLLDLSRLTADLDGHVRARAVLALRELEKRGVRGWSG